MPYIWTEPELVLKHRGVSVYHVYKDGWWDCGRREFLYTTDITEQSRHFDIRDLVSFQDSEEHIAIMKRAIDTGELTPPVDGNS